MRAGAPAPHEDAIARVCAAIGEHGWAAEPSFLSAATVAALRAEAHRRHAAGEFRAAGIGRNRARAERVDIRGDRILWLDELAATVAELPLWRALGALRTALNEAFFLGLFSFEGHYALYPPDAFYRRHRDRFRDDDARIVSFVLYLNEDWSPRDGGALRMHLDDGACDIWPDGGTAVSFMAERFEHEVLPSARQRLAVTGWFRRRP
ncbi:MAG: 2OG-Fe(II) oxygenase [Casimicrobiaceae bacterium]